MEGGGGDDTFPWHTRGAGAGDHLLSLRSRRSLSTTAATTGEPVVDASGHHVVEVQPRADDDNGDGSSTMCSPPAGPGPGVHLVLAFQDLTYSVKREGARMKMLLDGISGEAREGEMVAVLGASGAGKSTLIDALANRIQRGSLRGTVTLNGEALDGRLLRVISAYVMQEDRLHPMLTVTETMMYSAELRLPHSLSASAKRSRVHALIDQLGLGAAANTIIGDEAHRGVSGGERRRVSIGIDIVHNPIILFLDEPTSGLDSTIAFTVVKVLQRIARSGSVVIMSVHQPSHRIIGLLDRLLFLSRGRTVFYGPPSAMPLFFSELGQPIPEGENPAEFALDHIRELEMHDDDDDDDGTEEDELGLLVQFNKSWQKNNNKKKTGTPPPMMSLEEAISLSLARGKLLVAADSMDMELAAAGRSSAVVEVEAYANQPWVEIWILTRRGLTNMRRTKEQLLIRFGAVVLTAFVMATVFGRLDNTPKGVSERFSFFAIAMCTLFFTSADALPVFLLERYIFFRETAHNAYRRSSYTLSNAIVAFLPLLVLSVTFAGITFFALGLAGGWEGFAFFVLVVLASFWAGSGFVTFVSGVVQHVIIGCAVVAALMCYFMLFSGFFVKRDRIAYYWIWFHYLSLMKYPYEAMMQNEFGADPEKCFMRGVQVFDGTLMGKLPVETQVTVLNAMSKSVGVHFDSSTCVTTGRDILAQQAVDQLGKWGCLWVTFASGFLFRLLFHLTLLLGTKNKRK